MLRLAFYGLLLTTTLGLTGGLGLALWLSPRLPATERLQDVRFQIPLRIFTHEGRLIAEFGEKRRTPVAIGEVPERVRLAFIAAEDDRFYEHPGVDWMALVRAAIAVATSRARSQGGSTITMQVARNFFLTPEKTYQRKLKEIALAFRIERELSKDQILELYLNKIFLGQRAYGVAAAAQIYFGRPLAELTVAEAALIAGLPKAPSRLNPIANPEAARERRRYVLGRMHALGFIDADTLEEAEAAPLPERLHGQPIEVEAPHAAEMVREFMVGRFGARAYTRGYRVITTLDGEAQRAAVRAVRQGLDTYERRHGYRGPEGHVELAGLPPAAWPGLLRGRAPLGPLQPALVTAVDRRAVTVVDGRGEPYRIDWEGLAWARKFEAADRIGRGPAQAADLVKVGDIVRITRGLNREGHPEPAPAARRWRLAQLPRVEGALVALDARDGGIRALVGGYDFARSKFNRVNQALRQPGSNFKPFIYSAALEHGYTPGSIVNDAPIVFEAPGLDEKWRPENYSGTYYGPTPLREALAQSRNLVSIRVMRDIGIEQTVRHVARFGFDPAHLPHNLSLSLGTGELTPLQIARGYAVFASGGFLLEPYLVAQVEDAEGREIFRATPPAACADCELSGPRADDEPADLEALIAAEQASVAPHAARAVTAQNAWLMYSMMKDVITRGTARRALQLGRRDLAGKTGTTNDLKDAWFSGFNAALVTTVWVGLDDSTTLGPLETGARTALPIWIEFMREALEDTPLAELPLPEGLVNVRNERGGTRDESFETLRAEDARMRPGGRPVAPPAPAGSMEQLF